MIVPNSELSTRFQMLLQSSSQLDVAAAWVGLGPEIDEIEAFSKRVGKDKIRIVAGISGNATNPIALQRLLDCSNLRIPKINPLFHMKIYIFHNKNGLTCWVGSANLTRRGFHENVEAVFEVEDDISILRTFEENFNICSANAKATAKNYIKTWTPPEYHGFVELYEGYIQNKYEVSIEKLESGLDWKSYYRLLNLADAEGVTDAKYSVFDEYRSWMNTIEIGNRVVKSGDWINDPKKHSAIIIGREGRPGAEGFGLLGSMGGAGQAAHILSSLDIEAQQTRSFIFSEILKIIDVSRIDFKDAAEGYFNAVTSIEYIGVGVASKLLALARPDVAVSLNGGSRGGLEVYSGIDGLRTIQAYLKLLEFLSSEPWYNSEAPDEPFERLVWSRRAALIDCLVYRPVAPRK